MFRSTRFIKLFFSYFVCVDFQMFVEGVSSVEVTQLTCSAQQQGGAAKRRRVETGWAALSDVIAENINTLHAVTW